MSEPEPTFAAACAEEVETAKTRRKARRSTEESDLMAVLATAEGTRVLARLLAATRVLGPAFDADPLKTAFNEGARTVGLTLIAWIGEADESRLASLLFSPAKD